MKTNRGAKVVSTVCSGCAARCAARPAGEGAASHKDRLYWQGEPGLSSSTLRFTAKDWFLYL